jgi:formylglycine-generating enzyme required for sulfatase activity
MPSPPGQMTHRAHSNSRPESATNGHAFINILGMSFVRIPGTRILLCSHLTRKRDYRLHSLECGTDNSWDEASYEGVPVSTAEDHPVVMVNWEEAGNFNRWLSETEGRKYRLPTDHEWSCAVGIGEREDPARSPHQKSSAIHRYPWGTEWPPPRGAGNFADEAARRTFPKWTVIEGYDDGWATTSPVMSFPPNDLGLYDLAGNVWEWCGDWSGNSGRYRVLRGGSWFDLSSYSLMSSRRRREHPERRHVSYGFRCALELDG